MALGKSSLSRVAHSSVIPAPEKEIEKVIVKAEIAATEKPAIAKQTAATEKTATPKKPRTHAAPQKTLNAAYAVGDDLPVWLL